MKSFEWLSESKVVGIRSKLTNYVTGNKEYQDVGNGYYLYIWTEKEKQRLLKAGCHRGLFERANLPGQAIGWGVVNLNTSDVALFGIDWDYEVGGISSLGEFTEDNQEIFFKDKPALYDVMLTTLENLAHLLQDYGHDTEVNTAEKIKNKLWNTDGLEDVSDEIDDLDTLDEAREKLEDILKDAQRDIANKKREYHKQDRLLSKISKSGNEEEIDKQFDRYDSLRVEVANLQNIIDILPEFLEEHADLFEPGTPEGDAQEELKKWTRHFNKLYPRLPMDDATDFDPNKGQDSNRPDYR